MKIIKTFNQLFENDSEEERSTEEMFEYMEATLKGLYPNAKIEWEYEYDEDDEEWSGGFSFTNKNPSISLNMEVRSDDGFDDEGVILNGEKVLEDWDSDEESLENFLINKIKEI